jgi:DNA-binding beta-propeller fold protein YncE
LTLVRTGFVPIPPGATPGFDHADVFPSGGRLYVAHTGADRIDVLDCASRNYLRALPESLPGVAGVLIDSAQDLLFSSDRGADRVRVFRCSDEVLLGQAGVGSHPNELAYDRERRRLYSFNLGDPVGEGCSASVIDVDSMDLLAELPLPGRPRWAVYEAERDAVYVTIREPSEILVIDGERAAIVRAFPVPSPGRMDPGSMPAGCSAPPTAAPWSCSAETPARCWQPCRCRGGQTSSCAIPLFGGSTWR